jgi:glycine cleavage system H protein
MPTLSSALFTSLQNPFKEFYAMSSHDEYIMPEELLVAESHEYLRLLDDDRALVGITEYAASQLGDIVFVELPDIGQRFEKGESFGSIESVKAQSDLYLPVSGEIVAINGQLGEEPETVNDAPYEGGWLVEISLIRPKESSSLMNPDAYLAMIDAQSS